MSFSQLLDNYELIGTEPNNIACMKEFFKLCRIERQSVKLHAGSIPSPYAELVIEKGADVAIHQAKVRRYIAPDDTCHVKDD
jgi:hypothetical protein